jgi:DUF971 family protein
MDADSSAPPEDVSLATDRCSIALSWHADAPRIIGAAALRAACRCAQCVRDRTLGRFAVELDGIRITGVELVATYAINIAFSDGHDRGIFPWGLLRQLAARGGASSA